MGDRWEQIAQRELQEALRSLLVGLPLSDYWKPIFHVFEFGEQKPKLNKRGVEITKADVSLNVECSWRIRCGTRYVMGSDDFEFPRSVQRVALPRRRTPPGDPNDAIRWRVCQQFFREVERASLVVRRVQVSALGDLKISLSRNHVLDVWVQGSGWMLHTPHVTWDASVALSGEVSLTRSPRRRFPNPDSRVPSPHNKL
ncbi:MAG: hypothetical protein M9921_11090 [Fimbriimonadaceae bacterium]|nr:hypothetical protein [Fimbriimonadaceae bacterium]